MTRKCAFSLVFGLLLLLAVSCGGDEAPDPTVAPTRAAPESSPRPDVTATPQPTATVPPTPTPLPRPEANAFPPELQEEADRLLQQIVELRGSPLSEPVDMFLLTREQARAYYSRDDEAEEEPEPSQPQPPRLDTRQEVYELLGLIPPIEETGGRDIEEQEVDNLISIVTGFYEHAYRAFYMIDTISGGIDGPLAISTIVHELTHALQYQDADINAIAGGRSGNFDARTALLSVMEGDAVYTELQVLGYSTRTTYYREPACFTIPPPRNEGTPYAVERELDVWYEEGLCFMRAIAEQSPEAIAAIFDDLPESMEQILHPEKYLADEAPIPVQPQSLEAQLGGSWERAAGGVFGEFGLQNILLTGLAADPQRVQAAAAGWGGDAWRLYVDGDARLLHHETAWDTEADAGEFRDTLIESLSARGFAASEASETSYVANLNGVTWTVVLDGQDVTVLVSNDDAAMAAAGDALS